MPQEITFSVGYDVPGFISDPVFIDTTDHPQVFVRLASGEMIRCDQQIAAFIRRLNDRINPKAKTDFSCQGDPDDPKTSAYLLVSSGDEDWMRRFVALAEAGLNQFTERKIKVLRNGTWPKKRMMPFGAAIRIETDIIEEDYARRLFLGTETLYRAVVRWRPEDFERVCMGFQSVFEALEKECSVAA